MVSDASEKSAKVVIVNSPFLIPCCSDNVVPEFD